MEICKETGKSTSGYLVMMGTSWNSKLQSIVTLSTTEAEYEAAVSAGQEIVWMCQLLSEMGYSFNVALKLLTDNQSALSGVCGQEPRTPWQDETLGFAVFLAQR